MLGKLIIYSTFCSHVKGVDYCSAHVYIYGYTRRLAQGWFYCFFLPRFSPFFLFSFFLSSSLNFICVFISRKSVVFDNPVIKSRSYPLHRRKSATLLLSKVKDHGIKMSSQSIVLTLSDFVHSRF